MQPKTPSDTETPSASAVSSDLVRGLKDAAAWFRLNGDPDGAKRLMDELAALDPRAARSLTPPQQPAASEELGADVPVPASALMPVRTEHTGTFNRAAPALPPEVTSPLALQPHRDVPPYTAGLEEAERLGLDSHRGRSLLLIAGAVCLPIVTAYVVHRVVAPDENARATARPVAARNASPFADRKLSLEPESPVIKVGADDPMVPLPTGASAAVVPQVRWTLTSTPPGAEVVRVDTGEKLGRTPLELDVDQAAEAAGLRFLLPTHRPIEVKASREADAAVSVSFVNQAPAGSSGAKKQKPAVKAKSRKNNRDDLLDPYGN
ncbi:MAG: hypothetical protein ACT4TC_25175 [Myxococcaceae bacterium]